MEVSNFIESLKKNDFSECPGENVYFKSKQNGNSTIEMWVKIDEQYIVLIVKLLNNGDVIQCAETRTPFNKPVPFENLLYKCFYEILNTINPLVKLCNEVIENDIHERFRY